MCRGPRGLRMFLLPPIEPTDAGLKRRLALLAHPCLIRTAGGNGNVKNQEPPGCPKRLLLTMGTLASRWLDLREPTPKPRLNLKSQRLASAFVRVH